MYELMIIGGGPAGLAASVYATRKRLKTLLVTDDIGGQVNWTVGVENYLGYQFIEGPELIEKFQTQVNQFPYTGEADSGCCWRRGKGSTSGSPLPSTAGNMSHYLASLLHITIENTMIFAAAGLTGWDM